MESTTVTRLVDELGLAEGQRARFVHAPKGYLDTLGKLPDDLVLAGPDRSDLDFVQVFSSSREHLESVFGVLEDQIALDGMLWVCWPKAGSGVETDLDRETVREIGLAHGLVDVEVCSVDEIWSGLKFVYRSEDR